MTIAVVDLGRKATKPTNQKSENLLKRQQSDICSVFGISTPPQIVGISTLWPYIHAQFNWDHSIKNYIWAKKVFFRILYINSWNFMLSWIFFLSLFIFFWGGGGGRGGFVGGLKFCAPFNIVIVNLPNHIFSWPSLSNTVDNHVTCGQWANRMLQRILMKNQYILTFWRWVTSIFSWFYNLFEHHLLISKHIRSCEWSCL